MRYATVTLTWTHGDGHPIDAVFAGEETVRIEAIRYVSPVQEGQYVELLELRGDLERARSLLADAPEVLEFDVAGADGQGVAYVQCLTAGLVDDLLAILRKHEIVLEWPMRSLERSESRGVEITVFGTSRAIQRAAADLPDGVRLDLARLGEYEPDDDRLSATLTERQRELFELAVDEGYYEVPRETTHRELADMLGLAPGTVSEHLQRVESKLVDAYTTSS